MSVLPRPAGEASGRSVVLVFALVWVLALVVLLVVAPEGTRVSSDPSAPTQSYWVVVLPAAVGIALALLLPPRATSPARVGTPRSLFVTTLGLAALAVTFTAATGLAPLSGEDYILAKAVLLMAVPGALVLVVRRAVRIAPPPDGWRWWPPWAVVLVWTLLSQVAPWNPGFELGGLDRGDVVLAASATAITAGLGEELFFRRWLQTRLEAWAGGPVGVALASTAFALMHLGSHGSGQPVIDVARVLVAQGSFGVLAGVLWWRYRSLAAIVVLHVIANGWAVATALLLETP